MRFKGRRGTEAASRHPALASPLATGAAAPRQGNRDTLEGAREHTQVKALEGD